MRFLLEIITAALVAVRADQCDRLKAWIHVDGTKSFSTFIKDRGAYVQSLSEAMAAKFTTFSYGVSAFGDRQADKTGPQDTCFYMGVENPATTTAVTSFFSSFTEVDDGKDAAESSVDTSMFLLAHKWAPSAQAELRALIIITDAPGKTEGEGVAAGTEGTTDLVAPDACVTCDNAYKLPKRDLFIEMLIKMDVAPLIITSRGDSVTYWSKVVSDVGRGGVLASDGDGAKDATRLLTGLTGMGCSGNSGGSGKGKKSKTGLIIGALIGAILCLLLIGFLVWWFFLRGGKSNKTAYPGSAAGQRTSLANNPVRNGQEESEEDDEEEEDEDEDDDDEEEEEDEDEDEEEV